MRKFIGALIALSTLIPTTAFAQNFYIREMLPNVTSSTGVTPEAPTEPEAPAEPEEPAGTPPTLINGGFEDGFNGWSVVGNLTLEPAGSTRTSTAVKMPRYGSVTQTVTTQVGVTYRLTFWEYIYGSHRHWVFINGALTQVDGTVSSGNKIWDEVYVEFVGTGEPMTIKIEGRQGFDFVYIELDNVWISEI